MNYRRKDYIIPRSMKEAFGNDDSFEPELRCCSELFNQKGDRPFFPAFILMVVLAVVVWQVIKNFAH